MEKTFSHLPKCQQQIKMKTAVLIILSCLSLTACTRSDINRHREETNACLKNDDLIWPPSKERGDTTLKARFKEQVELQKIKDGDWYRYLYKITYDNIEVINGQWKHPELTFLCKDTWPTEESGIKVKKLPWPFRENEYMIFEINHENDKNLILGYRKDVLKIIPGESIAGIALGMTDEQVIEKLGDPLISDRDNGLFYYKNPPLLITFHNNTVNGISLSYYENISVTGYPFLAFQCFAKEDIDLLGKPSAADRIKDFENVMMANAPEGTIIEYYQYIYEPLGISLGLVFDIAKQQKGEDYIWVNRINVIPRQDMNHNR
jgi:hypothetical protein